MTEEEARKRLGPKMCARLDALNAFLAKYNYGAWFHSTSVGEDIIKGGEGLRLNVGDGFGDFSYESREDLSENITISDSLLDRLEETARQNPGKTAIVPRIFLRKGKPRKENHSLISSIFQGGDFGEDPQSRRATVYEKGSHISAVDLLTYNHQGQMQTVIGVCPNVPHPDYRKHYGIGDNRYLIRGEVSCVYEEGEYTYGVRTYYPKESILMVYDRKSNRVLMNKDFDERALIIADAKQRTDLGYPQTGTLVADMKREVDAIDAAQR